MADGDDGLLGPQTNDQALKATLELARGACCRPGDLAQDGAHVAVARCGGAAFAFAGGLMVARTHAGPFGEPVGTAEGGHVIPDLHQQSGGRNAIDAGDGQQQLQRRLLGFEPLQQTSFEVGQLRFQSIDVMKNDLGDEPVLRAEFTLQRGERLVLGARRRPAWPRASSGVPPSNRIDHRPRGDAVQVGNHPAQADAGIAEHFGQAVFLHRQHGGGALVAAADLAQGAQLFRRNEAAPQEAGAPALPAIRRRWCRSCDRAPV